MRKRQKKAGDAHLLGVGLDNRDGHTRITRGRDFTVLSGSAESHEKMTEFCIKVHEQLDRKGRRLASLTPSEFRDLAGELL
jgi:hypothetical protein